MNAQVPKSKQGLALDVMSGRTRGLGASVARAALGLAEPGYAGIASLRNRLFDAGLKSVLRLPPPVICVGNLTTGGTGKTPAVQWLVRLLRDRGRVPGVLTRGYRRAGDAGGASDEEQLLRESLGCPVVAEADRHRGGLRLLAESPAVDVLVLDDGFQHRRLARDLDVVLIDATNPFGFGHVLPRGLLREPIGGIARAGLVIVTRADLVGAAEVERIEARVRRHHASVPIVRTTHRLAAPVTADGSTDVRGLTGRRVYALSGIGNPRAFEASLVRAGAIVAGARHFPDHHAYRDEDARAARASATTAAADAIVTTEKDWVKLRALPAIFNGTTPGTIPVVRVGVALHFDGPETATASKTIDGAIAPRNLHV